MTEYARHGLALDEYTKSTPPGWRPHMHDYPLKLFLEKFDLWKRQTSVPEEEIGVTMAGRLKGAAYRLAIKIKIQTYKEGIQGAESSSAPAEGSASASIADDVLLDAEGKPIPDKLITDTEAISHLAQKHPTTGKNLNESGWTAILDALQDLYGSEKHDIVAQILGKFFKLYRGNGSLLDYCFAFKQRYETANDPDKAGLSINTIGRTHLFLENAGLHPRFVDDIMLKVDHNREGVSKDLRHCDENRKETREQTN